MNDDKIIYLVDIRDELQSFIHDDDPNDAFMAGWEWWKDYNLRHRFRTYEFFKRAETEQSIPRKDAESLCHFLHDAHVWKCLK